MSVFLIQLPKSMVGDTAIEIDEMVPQLTDIIIYYIMISSIDLSSSKLSRTKKLIPIKANYLSKLVTDSSPSVHLYNPKTRTP